MITEMEFGIIFCIGKIAIFTGNLIKILTFKLKFRVKCGRLGRTKVDLSVVPIGEISRCVYTRYYRFNICDLSLRTRLRGSVAGFLLKARRHTSARHSSGYCRKGL